MPKEKSRSKKISEIEQQKWFVKEDLQDLAKIGGDFFKKKVSSSFDVLKDVKENFPKEASQLLNKGKEELLKGLSQETARNLVSFAVDKFFKLACEHRLEFSIRIRRNDDVSPDKMSKKKTKKRRCWLKQRLFK